MKNIKHFLSKTAKGELVITSNEEISVGDRMLLVKGETQKTKVGEIAVCVIDSEDETCEWVKVIDYAPSGINMLVEKGAIKVGDEILSSHLDLASAEYDKK